MSSRGPDPCPPGEHDDEVIARAGTLALALCHRCGMRFVRGLNGAQHVPRAWVAWLNGKTDERPGE